ncbi:MAG TPA: signal peptidase I [Oscillospiraceae bacterium]|nr:signal peptidase I [Oscillospiraceae bacterium]
MEEETALAEATKQQSGQLWRKALQISGNLVFALLLLMLVLLTITTVQSRLKGKPPQLAGYQMYIVLGGSMSPTFEMGSLAFLKPIAAQDVVAGDIITYSSPFDAASLTTHRVMEIHDDNGQLYFTTRGDANDVNDLVPALAANVVGKVVFALPYLGYVLHFGRSKLGLIMLVVLPGFIIMLIELRNILRYYTEWKQSKESQAANEETAVEADSPS